MTRAKLTAAVVAAALIFPTAALGGLSRDVQQGQRLAESVRSGQQHCSDLSAEDFELIGEYAMERFLGNPHAHAAMNRHMSLMMGGRGEERMHMALGYRYSRCPGGPASGWVGRIGGMMSGRRVGPGNFEPGMMGEYRGGMMGSRSSGDTDIGVLGVVLISFAAAVLGGGLVFMATRRSSPER
jgi:hypothetical protein